MILLDSDLDPPPHGRRPVRGGPGPDPSPQSKPARTVAPAGISTRSLALFLRKAQTAVRLRGQVSVLLTTDAAIRKLNRQFRGKNKATDVLSFPVVDMFAVTRSRPGAPENRLAGDLAISVDTARKQASACGHSLGIELKVLMLHGLLHLAGYDHETDGGEMAKRESALRAKFGLPLGLIERAGFPTVATGKNRKYGARKLLPPHPSRKNNDAARMGHPVGQRVGKLALSHPSRKNNDAARMGHPAGVSARRRKP